MRMRIAFLGTPDFALPSLRMLLEEGYEVAGVFTQPDKPVGRSGKLKAPPVKVFAQERGIPVCQPARIRSEEGLAALRALQPDLMVTAAFGQILSAENLAVPRLGCINVHGSLLPKYRGAAPVQWSVINGETETGVTTMLTDVGLDTGDMLVKKTVAIGPDETAGELFERIALVGAETLRETLALLEAGKLQPVPQVEAEATHCPMLKKEHGHIDWKKSAGQVHNLVRGVNPWPGAFALFRGEPLKIWRTRPAEGGGAPGEVLCSSPKQGLIAACGEGAVEVLELQAPGGKRMEARTYLRGKNIPEGEFLQ